MNLIKSTLRSIFIFTIILIVFCLIYTLLLYNNILTFDNQNISIFSFIIGIVLFILLGLFSSIKSDSKGWLKGLISGITVYSIVIIFKSLRNDLNDIMIIIKIITYLLSSTFGGIIGINMNKMIFKKIT